MNISVVHKTPVNRDIEEKKTISSTVTVPTEKQYHYTLKVGGAELTKVPK